MAVVQRDKTDYGVDAPGVMRNFFLSGGACLLLAVCAPNFVHLGPVTIDARSFFWPAGVLLGEGLLFLLYVKVGKFRHRDFMLGLHAWTGDEEVLDVGWGRGLLLAGAAKRMEALKGTGRGTGIDIWSSVDMGGNAEGETRRNLELEGVPGRCTLVSEPAEEMRFASGSFDVVVSNLCLHNIPDRAARARAVQQIARVLKPGGQALISDYKKTGEYAAELRRSGLEVRMRWGSWLTTFPPLRVVIARKPVSDASKASSASN